MSNAIGDDSNEELSAGLKPLTDTDPRRIGPYLLLGRLGSGGMGRVYLARSGSGRTVAVKVVHEEHTSDAQFRARFRREIDAARRVGGRYTAPVLEADPDASRPWVATGYVPGLTLEQVVRRYGPLPAESVHALTDGLLRALKDIHTAGIVHRDLKASNVMLTVDGPRVIDFGIARALDSMESLLTSTGLVIGSPGFMSPEQIRGRSVGPKSDVFTLGCVLTYAATGLLPFGRDAVNQHAVMYQIAEDEPDLTLVRDERLRALISRCLTKDADERPDTDALLTEQAEAGPDGHSAGAAGAWLPRALVAELAQQAARLLDVDAPVVREPEAEGPQPPDRATVGLGAEKPAAEAPPEAVTPETAAAGTGEQDRRDRKRSWRVAVPAIAVFAIGGGTMIALQPFGGDTHASPPAHSSTPATGPGGDSSSGPASSPSPSRSGKSSPGAGHKKKGGTTKGQGDGGPSGGSSGGGGQATSGSGGSAGTSTRTSGGGSASGSASGGSTGGSTGGTSGGSSGSGSKVPSYFVGTWSLTTQYAVQPEKVSISRAATGRQAVRLFNDNVNGIHCETVAKLVSVGSNGSQINIGAAAVDPSRSDASCQKLDSSSFKISGNGIQHDVGPAHGDGYHYERT